jgi:hypothetical protein
MYRQWIKCQPMEKKTDTEKNVPKKVNRNTNQLQVDLLDKKMEEIQRKQQETANRTDDSWKVFESVNYGFYPPVQKAPSASPSREPVKNVNDCTRLNINKSISVRVVKRLTTPRANAKPRDPLAAKISPVSRKRTPIDREESPTSSEGTPIPRNETPPRRSVTPIHRETAPKHHERSPINREPFVDDSLRNESPLITPPRRSRMNSSPAVHVDTSPNEKKPFHSPETHRILPKENLQKIFEINLSSVSAFYTVKNKCQNEKSMSSAIRSIGIREQCDSERVHFLY